MAIIAPILGYSKTIGQLADGYRQWVHAEETFGEIRERLELGQSVSFDEYEKAKERVLPTQQSEIGLPRDERLMEACRQGVLKEVGVSDAR
ncbi:MAG TPA: hypothetical protein VEY12_08840 [Thermoplasmata archaeon]|nr:hypothetical protein [Thermoplasmata archaeon]